MKSKEVVAFVDVSQQAYGAWYLRCEYEDGTATSRLIASKSKVALLTPMTVSRLELMRAIVGLRLTQSVSSTLGLPIRAATFYSDSTDVLCWILGRGRDFWPFVANHIGRYRSVLNQLSGSMFPPMRIQQTCFLEEQALLNLPNPKYGGMVLSGWCTIRVNGQRCS